MGHRDETVLGPDDAGWPAGLSDLAVPPSSIRVLGALPSLEKAVAIVGTRSADAAAVEMAFDLAADLCACGCVVISGGARGIDASAHQGALCVDGATLAVLPSGFAPPYPRGHGPLFHRIAVRGALITEHADRTAPHPGRFLERNRLVAALARAVVVVQAPARSGALSTARWARLLGRPVLAVPAAPWDPRGHGCIGLIRRGAPVCTCARDVLSVCSLGGSGGAGDEHETATMEDALAADERRLLEVLRGRPRDVDELAAETAWDLPRIRSALLSLLLAGCAEEGAGGRWSRRRRSRFPS